MRPTSTSNFESNFNLEQIKDFIVPLPEKVFLTAEDAQKAIEKVLNDSHPQEAVGYKKCSPSLANEKIVLRLFLTTTRAFKRKITKRGMGNSTVVNFYRQMPMPHFIWVCEIAIQDEYSTNFKVRGEIIWDATRNAKEPDGWLALHYPELLIIDTGCYANLPHNLERIPLENSLPYDLFRSNLTPHRQ